MVEYEDFLDTNATRPILTGFSLDLDSAAIIFRLHTIHTLYDLVCGKDACLSLNSCIYYQCSNPENLKFK